MQIAIAPFPGGLAQVRLEPDLCLGAHWAQFGDEVFLFAQERRWRDVTQQASLRGVELRRHPRVVREDRLFLVIQRGRLFQQEHADVPVVFDKGRYLVVDLAPERASKIGTGRSPCYSIRPLPKDARVFDVRPRAAPREVPAPWIEALLGRMSRRDYEADLAHLASLPTRHSTSPHYAEAASWACGQLRSIGYAARLEEIRVDDGTSRNVIADRPGSEQGPRDLVLVTAHLDSINHLGGPDARAPGADDNASGSAGVLAIARALRDHAGRHDLRLVLFGGEEEGLHGSRQFVEGLPDAERRRIRAVVNMDMIGSQNSSVPTVLLEGAEISRSVVEGLADAAHLYTDLCVQTSFEPHDSDHVPFIEGGLPAVLIIEGADGANGRVHSSRDTIDSINYDLALRILRMNAALVARQLGQAPTDGGGVKPVAVSDTAAPTGAPPPPPAGAPAPGPTGAPPPPPAGAPAPGAPDVVITMRPGTDIAQVLKSLGYRYSGRYTYNGGVGLREARGFIDLRSGQNLAALENPMYKLEGPVYLDPPEESERATPRDALRLTLHIDFDGDYPLNAASGTVTGKGAVAGTPPPHFIGRITSQAASGDTRTLIVEDFLLTWPDSDDRINRLELKVCGSLLAPPTAEATFVDVSGRHRRGPYSLIQESTSFRDVEVEVAHQEGAAEVEPYNTHTHPDRPTNLSEETLTLESVYAKAGIRITRSPNSGRVIVPPAGGSDYRWTNQELHDAMTKFWRDYQQRPQWKMWIFLSNLGPSDRLGGIMFDANINEPGGVDRQGAAIFTRCPYFHTEQGEYIKANPPAAAAIKRELFFNLIHESGHAYNLAHSFQKLLSGDPAESPWSPPSWLPLVNNPQALSWMNYPDSATPGPGAGVNATWFYKRFHFQFDRGELLFLRHAPEEYVQMGNAGWFHNHARIARSRVDRRLELVLRSQKEAVEYGENVFLELRLKNLSDQPITIHKTLDPCDGYVELAITDPAGRRRPFIPIAHTRVRVDQMSLPPQYALYKPINLAVGQFGFPFKEPGPYRIEASYVNFDETGAAAVMQLYVRPPASFEDMRTVHSLFDAELGRTLFVKGTRLLETVNDKLDWASRKLGPGHPACYYFAFVRQFPWAFDYKQIDPGVEEVRLLPAEPDRFVQGLEPILKHPDKVADSLGHMTYKYLVNTFTEAAQAAGDRGRAHAAQKDLLEMFTQRNVLPAVIQGISNRMRELE